MTHHTWIGWGLAATVGIAALTDVALAQTKLSGTIVSVAPDGAAIAFEESGVAGQVIRHMIRLAPDARVVHVTRASENGEFIEQPANALDLRAGDFVTVTVDGGGPGLPPRAANPSDTSGMASPSSEVIGRAGRDDPHVASVARTVEIVRPR